MERVNRCSSHCYYWNCNCLQGPMSFSIGAIHRTTCIVLNTHKLFSDWMRWRSWRHQSTSPPHPIREHTEFIEKNTRPSMNCTCAICKQPPVYLNLEFSFKMCHSKSLLTAELKIKQGYCSWEASVKISTLGTNFFFPTLVPVAGKQTHIPSVKF